jgi:hypothetical protein
MEGFWDIPKRNAMDAYTAAKYPSLTDQLLYAILAQLDKISHQLDKQEENE